MAVLTAADIPGENGLGDYSQEEPVLCPVGATVRMVGAPIALVVGETPERRKAGLAAVEVGYELLPHVFETDEALQPGAPHIAGRRDNVLTDFAVKHGDLDAAFADFRRHRRGGVPHRLPGALGAGARDAAGLLR